MDDRYVAVVALIMFLIFIVVLVYTAVAYFAASGRYRRAKARVERLQHMEKLARLRHRDLDAFAKELNIIRAKKGKRGIPKATLVKIQYNLMYSIDED